MQGQEEAGSALHLVVGLSVGHAGLLVAPVGQRVHDVAHLPLVVRLLAQQLDPLVRDGHLQPVVEADASLLHRPAPSSIILCCRLSLLRGLAVILRAYTVALQLGFYPDLFLMTCSKHLNGSLVPLFSVFRRLFSGPCTRGDSD